MFGLVAAAALSLAPLPARALVHEGGVAPEFHKLDLSGTPHTLSQYRGKVVVMFLLGYF